VNAVQVERPGAPMIFAAISQIDPEGVQLCADDRKSGEIPGTTTKL
jgi:hypothetical protein